MEEHVLIGKQCLLVPVCQEGWLCFDWMRLYTCHNHFNAPWLFELSHQTLCLINLPQAIPRNSTHPCSRQPCTHATMQPTPPCTSRTSATSPRLRVFQTAWPSLSLHGIESECVTYNVCFEYQASHDHSTLRLFSHSSPPRYMAGHVVELEYDGAMLMGLSDVLM